MHYGFTTNRTQPFVYSSTLSNWNALNTREEKYINLLFGESMEQLTIHIFTSNRNRKSPPCLIKIPLNFIFRNIFLKKNNSTMNYSLKQVQWWCSRNWKHVFFVQNVYDQANLNQIQSTNKNTKNQLAMESIRSNRLFTFVE